MTANLDESFLELWENYRDKRVSSRVLECASALADRDFTPVPVPTASEANRIILSLVPLHRTVLYWDNPALEELGIVSTLRARGNSTRSAIPLAAGRGRRKQRVPNRSVYLSTVCAVTLDGMLFKVEPDLVPIWGPGRVPESLILIAGFNHIVDGLEEGFRRAKDESVPQCARILNIEADCARTGRCVECAKPPAICCANTVVTRQPASPDIAVVLIGEKL